MTGDYKSLTDFVRQVIVNPNLPFNQLATTRSTVRDMLERFTDLGWTTEKVVIENARHPRHRVISPEGRIELSMNSAKVFRHPLHTEQICQRKHLTKRMLEFAGLPIPAGADFSPREKNVGRAFFEMVPKPVVIKPTNSGGSHGVTVGVTESAEFNAAWDFARDEGGVDSNVLIEQFVRGVELRALVVGDVTVSIIARVQPFVVGDGRSPLQALINEANEVRTVHYRATQLAVVIDWNFVARQSHDPESVPDDGEIVFLNPLGLPAYGALLVDVTNVVSSEIRDLAVRAKNAIPALEVGGIDLLVEDLNDARTAVVLEVNTAPSLNLHRYATHGEPREVHLDIVDYFHAQYLDEYGPPVNEG